jgi:hypothetical protein
LLFHHLERRVLSPRTARERAQPRCAKMLGMRISGPFLAGAILIAIASACAPTPSQTQPTTSPAGVAAATTPPASPAVSPSTAPAPSAGCFAFDAESIVGDYASLGYTCGAVQPSTQAAGYAFRSCQLVDADGRTRAIGIVTDPADDVADAYASIRGTASETVLDPTAALDPFSAILGAMLGESQGESMLPWLAGHLGDTYVTTTLGDLTIATYSESADDHSKLYVEIANAAYLAAPNPSGSPTVP